MNNDIQQLFFDIIRVAIGNQTRLSYVPTAREWQMLYDMAKKQSLVGICFAGVQRALSNYPLKDEDPSLIGIPEMLYLKWMGMAAKIQQKNEIVNRQCVELQAKLAAVGLRSCVLKGQGVAKLYKASLPLLRQSGDIDVWVDAPREKIVEWARANGGKDLTGDLHVDCKVFPDTSVELHFTPSIASNPKINKKLQEWFESRKSECLSYEIRINDTHSIVTPTILFNMVYLMHHIFRHYLYEGIGLRQLLDYYFVLVNASEGERAEAIGVINALQMEKFAGALMYVMQEVFAMDEQSMICPVDEKRGKRLLEVIMEGGNFGHSTEKYKITRWDKPWSRLSRYVRRNGYMLWDYPDEIVWNILTKLKIF